MIKLVYFDFNFWRVDILRLSLSHGKIPYHYKRIIRANWPQEKKRFPFGQLPIMEIDGKIFAHTHSMVRYCAVQSGLYAQDPIKALVIDQVIDWANEITLRIAPSIREKNIEKSSLLRKKFIKNELHTWFGYLENLFDSFSEDRKFFIQKFSIADITAWRVIHWFVSGQLDQIPLDFIDKYPILKKFYKDISNLKSFNNLKEFKDIVN
tara:strand:+ start:821 stop:1444 length:624 start_codon:yes stop_codon:yes gene_type:complete